MISLSLTHTHSKIFKNIGLAYQVKNAIHDSKGISLLRDGSMQADPARALTCPTVSYLRHSESPPHLGDQALPMMPQWSEHTKGYRVPGSGSSTAARILHQRAKKSEVITGAPMWVPIVPTKHCSSGMYQTPPSLTGLPLPRTKLKAQGPV